MSISVGDAMKLPIMLETKLVAGSSGLHNLIKWVTIVEVIEDISRFQEGEFLITTGFDLAGNEEKRVQFEKLLAHRRLSGVAIYTGFYLQEIPESFIKIANDVHLPIIKIPTNINFSMITRAILEQIVNRQMTLYSYSVNIHQQLTQLALEAKGIKSITQTLSRLIDGSLLLVQDDSILMDSCLIHDQMAAEEYASIEMIKEISAQHPELKIVSYPIIASGTHYGYLIAVKDNDKWSDLDQIAIEHAATVYAIEFLKQKAIRETEARLQGDFIDELLAPHFHNVDLELLADRGQKFGYDLTKNQVVFHLQLDLQCSTDISQKEDPVDQLYKVVSRVFQNIAVPFMLRKKINAIVVLAQLEFESEAYAHATTEIAMKIQTQHENVNSECPLIIGIGRHCQGIKEIPRSAKDAYHAVTFTKLLHKPKQIVHFNDLGVYHLLIQLQEAGGSLEEFYLPYLKNILPQKSNHADLILTLETYLSNSQNIHSSATELFIHRHTLKYRLNQIEKRTGLSLKSSNDRLKLQLAIMSYKLVTGTPRR